MGTTEMQSLSGMKISAAPRYGAFSRYRTTTKCSGRYIRYDRHIHVAAATFRWGVFNPPADPTPYSFSLFSLFYCYEGLPTHRGIPPDPLCEAHVLKKWQS